MLYNEEGDSKEVATRGRFDFFWTLRGSVSRENFGGLHTLKATHFVATPILLRSKVAQK